MFSQHIPLLVQLRGYTRTTLRDDSVAGLTTAIMLVPQAMAYAMLAGLDPIVGLYASTVPLLIYALFGSSRQLAVGPVAMVSLLVASGVAPLVADGDTATYLAYAGMLAFMVGMLQLGMGVARLGFLVRFLSHPVIAGFTSAAALIIGLSQLGHVLGVDLPRSHYVHEIALAAVERVAEVHPPTLALALGSVVALVVLERWAPRFPRFLAVVAAGVAIVWGFGLDASGVAIVGEVPSGLPTPGLPGFDVGALGALFPTALTIALVGFMESVSVAKAFARKNGYEIDADQELKSLGLANLGAALVRGYPVTGGFSRTAVNAQAGARTGVASLVTGVVVIVATLFLTPLFTYLPKAVLAAIILTAVAGLVDVREARHLWRVNRPDLALMGLTFAATLVLGIELGIGVGVAASLVSFVWRTSRPHVAVLGKLPGSSVYRNISRHEGAEQTPGVLCVRIDAPLYFANTAFLKQTLADLEADLDPPLRHLVLDAKAISSIDSTGAAALEEIVADLHGRGVEVWLSGVRGPVRDVLDATGLSDVLAGHVVERVHDAVCGLGDRGRTAA